MSVSLNTGEEKEFVVDKIQKPPECYSWVCLPQEDAVIL